MWNGTIGKTSAIFLVVLVVSACGSESGAAPSQATKSTTSAPKAKLPQVRYQVDPARNRVWFLSADGVFFYDVSKPEKVVVSLPAWQWVDAPYSSLPDIALGPKGEAVITSNIVPMLWTIDPETLVVSVHPLELDSDTDKDIGFSGLVYSSEHGVFFAVSYVYGSLWRIDPLFKRAGKIQLSAPLPKAFGLALQRRIPQQKAGRRSGICVSAPKNRWTINLTPDLRSASVRAAPCEELDSFADQGISGKHAP